MLLHRLSGGCRIADGDRVKDSLMLGGGLSRTVGAYKHSLEAFEQWLGPRWWVANERAQPRVDAKHGAVAISVQGSTAGLTELSLSLRGGEIVGLAGLEGSGVATVMQMLGGVVPVAGRLEVKVRATIFKNPSQAIANGVVYMPPDRKKDGLWLERDAGFNIGAARWRGRAR